MIVPPTGVDCNTLYLCMFLFVGVVRVGEVEGEFVINPTWSQLIISSLSLVVVCSENKVGKVLIQST